MPIAHYITTGPPHLYTFIRPFYCLLPFFASFWRQKKLLNYGVVGTWGTGGLHILVAIEAKNSPLKEKGLFTFPPHPQEETEDWPDSLSTYTQIFSSKKTGFPPVKNTSQIFFYFCLPLFYATFQCGRYNIFKKKFNLFFAHENIKNGLKSCS